jgi:hypothetical protein
VKILPDEVYRPNQGRSLDTINDRVQDLVESESIKNTQETLNNLTKKISEVIIKWLIYDEAKFVSFIKFCQAQSWIEGSEAEKCLADLQKESPQVFLSLFSKTEILAAPGWILPTIYEFLISGNNNILLIYALGSATRAGSSYYLSEGIVEDRKTLTALEAVPHAGRFLGIITILKTEHPELAHLLLMYFLCNQRYKKALNGNDEGDSLVEIMQAYSESNRKGVWVHLKRSLTDFRDNESSGSDLLEATVDLVPAVEEKLSQSPLFNSALNTSLRTAQVLGMR